MIKREHPRQAVDNLAVHPAVRTQRSKRRVIYASVLRDDRDAGLRFEIWEPKAFVRGVRVCLGQGRLVTLAWRIRHDILLTKGARSGDRITFAR